MKSPKNLSHKPIISVNNYDKIDGIYSNHSDAKALSIGQAQYDKEQISLKVWRLKDDENWNRQSEELPIHRNLDLSILALSSILTDVESSYPLSCLREEIDQKDRVIDIKNYYLKNEKTIRPRIEELKSIIDKFLENK